MSIEKRRLLFELHSSEIIYQSFNIDKELILRSDIILWLSKKRKSLNERYVVVLTLIEICCKIDKEKICIHRQILESLNLNLI